MRQCCKAVSIIYTESAGKGRGVGQLTRLRERQDAPAPTLPRTSMRVATARRQPLSHVNLGSGDNTGEHEEL